MKEKRRLRERICAFLLAVLMITASAVPNMALAVSAAEVEPSEARVIFQVTDNAGTGIPGANVVIMQTESMQLIPGEHVTDGDGKCTVSLTEGMSYTYYVEASGYKKSGNKTFVADANEPSQGVLLGMEEIQVNPTSLNMKVDDVAILTIENPIAGADYTWNTENAGIATVEKTGPETAIVKALSAEGDSTNLTVTCNGKETIIGVAVSKIATNMKLKVAPETGTTNVNSVTCTVFELPDDATGKIIFYVNEEPKGEIKDVKQKKSWTYEGNIIGTMSFKAVYVGDGKYHGCESKNNEPSYKRNLPLEFKDGNSNEINYGEDGWNGAFNIEPKAETIGDRNISYIVTKGSNVVEVDSEGNVRAKNSGEAEIEVTAQESDNYKPAIAIFTVTVNKKKIDLMKKFKWDSAKRVYNGSSKVELTGTLKENVQGDDNVKVTVIAEMADANVGNKKSLKAKVKDIKWDAGGNCNYVVDSTAETMEDVGVTADITCRPVYIRMKDDAKVILSYGEYAGKMRNAISETTGLIEFYGEYGIGKINDDQNPTGLVAEDIEDLRNIPESIKPTIDITDEKGVFYVNNEGYKIIHPDIPEIQQNNDSSLDSNKLKNYEIKYYENENYGTLIVKPQVLDRNAILQNLVVTGNNSGIYFSSDEPDKVWIKGISNKNEQTEKQGTMVELDVKSDNNFTDFYDQVYISFDGGKTYDNASEGIMFPAVQEENGVSSYDVKIYFAPSKHLDSRSIDKENSTEGTVIKEYFWADPEAPTVEFGALTAKKTIDSFFKSITFGVADKQEYTMSVEANDGEGCGVNNQSYYIWKKDVNISDNKSNFTQKEIVEKVQEINESGKWIPNLDGIITVAKAENEDEIKNNYVVLIKVTDNVGNTAIHNSFNDEIVKTQASLITLNLEPTESKYGPYYNGDVTYNLQINDSYNYISDLEKVKVEVMREGERVDEDSYEINLKDKENISLFKELQDKSRFKKNGTITGIDSNDVTITVTTINSSNIETAKVSQNLIIDTKAPQINISYDNNDVKNGEYYNKSRTMTITYTEKNFKKEDLIFDIKVGGTNKADTVTLDQLLDPLNTYKIQVVNDIDASESEDSENNKTHTLQLKFGRDENEEKDTDNVYEIALHCTDMAGNESSKMQAPEKFIIDQTKPTMKVKYTYVDDNGERVEFNPSEDRNARKYQNKNKNIKVDVTISDLNFSFAGKFGEDQKMNLKVKAENIEASENVPDYKKAAMNRNNWEKGGSDDEVNAWTATFDFMVDANYEFELSYTDLAGNRADHSPRYFTVDDTKPTGSVEVEKSTWEEFASVIFFKVFKNFTMYANLTADDATSGVKSIEYFKYTIQNENIDGEKVNVFENQKDLEKQAKWEKWEDQKVSISPNEQVVIYEKIEDRSGNVQYLNSEGIIADNVSPGAPVITISMTDPIHGIYNSNVPFNISVEDVIAGDTYSGLQSVSYEVRKDGIVTQSGNYDRELYSAFRRVRKLEKNETVIAESNNSNNVEIYVKAIDNAGNVSEAKKQIKIDITKPTIQVQYDLNSPLNGKYYKDTRTATVTVTERNFDESAVRFNITNTDGTKPTVSGWTRSANAGVSDSATNTCTVTFSADGDYTFTLNTTDLAGNSSEYTQVDEFTIDKTVPTVSVSYDNNSAKTPGYFDKARTATITIREHNFRASDVRTAITASLQSQGITAPSVSGWSGSGDVHTASVTYSADGDYTFDVDFTDLAGNVTADYSQDKFTVDQTKPEIEIFDIVDKSANNGTVAPGVRYSDVNYMESGVKISLTGVNHGSVNLDGERTADGNGESIKMADFEHTKEMDDLYTLKAEVEDKAGNVEEKSVMFSVNRFGSVYVFSDETKELLDRYYSNKEQDLEITEINVDTLEFNGISYGRDGELVNLKKGTDYTVKSSGSEESWKQYKYTVKKQNFEKEGNYVVTIDSKDRAENEVNNKIKDQNIEFVIDKTKPTVVITGIENNEQYRVDSRDITVAVNDNIAMDTMDIFIDGSASPEKSYTANMIAKAKGKIPYTIESARSFQEIKAVAVDAAGNKAESASVRALITSNLFVQFYSNKPLLFGSIGGAAVLAAALYILFAKKKKSA